MNDREEIADRYGLESFADLLDISHKLPRLPGDTAQSYVARSPDGNWFVWEDIPFTTPATTQP